MKVLESPSLDQLDLSVGPVLLVNAPAVDVRLPWARWLQPLGLLQLGTALKARGYDVRLIDCLQSPGNGRLARERVGVVELAGTKINVWRFGRSPAHVARQLRAWVNAGWAPSCVLVSCLVSTWWQGARDLIAELRKVTQCPIVLGGPYVMAYRAHAQAHTAADVLVAGAVAETEEATRDLALYRPGRLPRFAGLPFLRRAQGPEGGLVVREPEDIAKEVKGKAALGVTTFAFFDEWLGPEHREGLAAVLEKVGDLSLTKAGFVVIGNFSPRLVDTELAVLLRRAKFRQLSFHDDLEVAADGVERTASYDDYARSVQALRQAGFRARTDQISAAMVAGFPSESIGGVVERLVRLASIVGSVNLVPYQYTPGKPEADRYAELVAGVQGFEDPAALNAQLYPLARQAGAAIEDYWELTRLAALLNSKYRSQTFDFLGSTLAAHLVRNSLALGRWDPAIRNPASGLPVLVPTAGN